MSRTTRFMPMTEAQKQSRARMIAYHVAQREELKSMYKTRVDIPTAMLGVDCGGKNELPDEPPYNNTHRPLGYFTFLRGGSSAAMAAMDIR